jgi:hypothetical protein
VILREKLRTTLENCTFIVTLTIYFPLCLSNEEKNILNALQMWKVVVINTFHNVKLDLNGGFVETSRTEELF